MFSTFAAQSRPPTPKAIAAATAAEITKDEKAIGTIWPSGSREDRPIKINRTITAYLTKVAIRGLITDDMNRPRTLARNTPIIIRIAASRSDPPKVWKDPKA